MAFRLIPREEKFYADFQALADELNKGAVLLEEIRDPEIAIAEKPLLPADLSSASEVFITSTTRELLPVVSIEGLPIQGGRAVCDRLRKVFSAHVNQYVKLRPNPVYN